MQNTASEGILQKITQFELSNLIRKSKLFSKIKLAPATRLVLESLVYHYPNIRVNIKTLEEETGNSQRSVNNALSELKEKGLIITIQTGRSNIFKLTQKFFELLEVAPQPCRNEQVRHAEIALPHNKHEKKEINKTFQDKNLNNEVKKLLEKDSYLSNKQKAEIVLNGFHQYNTKESDYKAILQIKNIWNFKPENFDILRYFEQRKQTDQIFKRKIENIELEISGILQNYSKLIDEIRQAWQ